MHFGVGAYTLGFSIQQIAFFAENGKIQRDIRGRPGPRGQLIISLKLTGLPGLSTAMVLTTGEIKIPVKNLLKFSYSRKWWVRFMTSR
jgi:hypothetical protein